MTFNLSIRITNEEIRHIALLARIGITPTEIELIRDQMSEILESFDVLNNVDVEGIQATSHSVDLKTITREDKALESQSIEDTLLNAPHKQNHFVRVKPVLE